MERFILAMGMVLLMALPPLQAEYGGSYGKSPAGTAATGEAAVTISAPADGAVVAPTERVTLSYQATPGAQGDHVHLYVNGKRIAVLQQLAGDYELGTLPPGMHQISVQIVNRAHQHIGVGQDIGIEVR